MNDVVLFPEARSSERVVEELARMIIDAEDVAYRRALLDAGVDDATSNRLCTEHWATGATRARLIVARYRRERSAA